MIKFLMNIQKIIKSIYINKNKFETKGLIVNQNNSRNIILPVFYEHFRFVQHIQFTDIYHFKIGRNKTIYLPCSNL